MMTTVLEPRIDYQALIKEDRVHGRLYYDPAVFEDEFAKIWYRGWVYVGHDSEVAEPGDYRTKHIGRQPVIMTRDEEGEVRLLLNRCAHRGNLVCQNERGSANVFRCAYHGWTYSNKGPLIGATFMGAYGDSFRKEDFGLTKVPRVASYKGMIFGSLSATGPSLLEHLGLMSRYLDDYFDHSPVGELDLRSGVQKAKYRGNWKLMVENSLEGNYHGHFVHQFIFNLNRARNDVGSNALFNDQSPDVNIYLPGGHMVEDFKPEPGKIGDMAPVRQASVSGEAWQVYTQGLEERLGEERAQQLVREGPPLIFIFPNLVMIQSQIRVLQPVTPSETNVLYYPALLKGVPPEINRERLRGNVRRYGPGGFTSADDLEICERNQAGLQAQVDEWLHITRGLHREKFLPDGTTIGYGTDENSLRGLWRHYKKVMSEP